MQRLVIRNVRTNAIEIECDKFSGKYMNRHENDITSIILREKNEVILRPDTVRLKQKQLNWRITYLLNV